VVRLTLEHRPKRVLTPLTPWVHRALDGAWWTATRFEPPLPAPTPGLGHPVWVLASRGRELYFASPQEMAHAADVLGRRVLPSARELGRPLQAVNGHWLSRLHSSWKPWKVRQEMVKRLCEGLRDCERV
jgi:hypothetical protein